MSTPNVLIGILAKLYVNSGSYGSPTWDEVKLIGDLKVPAKWDVQEAMSRISRVKTKVKTALDIGITGTLLASLADAQYVVIRAALTTDDILDVLVLTGDKTANGNRGFRFDAQVAGANQDHGTGAVISDEFELIPVPSSNLPKSAVVTSGAPVLTAI